MVDFAKLKAQSGKSLAKLTSELNKINGNGTQESFKDDRFWYPNVDKAGNGYAVIRFLPAPGEEDVPFVRLFEHGFKGPTGSWYIENSLTTIGKQDPVGEYNTQLWNSGLDSDKEIARKQKRKLHFISNIYVVTDQQNPENEGKVFLFKYGKKIFDKLNDVMNPSFPDQEPMNPFDLWSGANFKLKIRNLEGYRNYDKSEFAAPCPLSSEDEEMEKIWKKSYSLKAFLDPSNFKSYDELKAKLNKVLGLDNSTLGVTAEVARKKAAENTDLPWQAEETSTKVAPAPKFAATSSSDDDEDMEEFFSKLNQ
jgi:gp32 DNA binding protein like